MRGTGVVLEDTRERFVGVEFTNRVGLGATGLGVVVGDTDAVAVGGKAGATKKSPRGTSSTAVKCTKPSGVGDGTRGGGGGTGPSLSSSSMVVEGRG